MAVANRCRRLPSAADGLRRRLMNRRVTAAANPTEASPPNKLCTHYYHTPPRPRQTPEPTAGSEPGLALDLVVFWRFTPEQVADEIIPAPAYMYGTIGSVTVSGNGVHVTRSLPAPYRRIM